MNILIISYSCNPYQGSEDKIGWNVAYHLSKTNEVFLITKIEQKPFVDKYVFENNGIDGNLKVFYTDIPAYKKKILTGIFLTRRQMAWHQETFKLAKKICAEHKIHIIHQITPVEFRSVGDYYKIPNIKFILGPIGGAEYAIKPLRRYLLRNIIFEIIRYIGNVIARISLKKKTKHITYMMFANRETLSFLQKCVVIKKYCLFPEIGLNDNEINVGNKKVMNNYVFVVVGRLVYRKGFFFVIDIVKKLVESNYANFKIVFVGDGVLKAKIINRIKKYNLEKYIEVKGTIEHYKISKIYQQATACLVPSIRETTGTVVLEALANGAPVITSNHFGGGLLIDDTVGWKYDGNSYNQIFNSVMDILKSILDNREDVLRKKQNAIEYAKRFTWKKKCEFYMDIYNKD